MDEGPIFPSVSTPKTDQRTLFPQVYTQKGMQTPLFFPSRLTPKRAGKPFFFCFLPKKTILFSSFIVPRMDHEPLFPQFYPKTEQGILPPPPPFFNPKTNIGSLLPTVLTPKSWKKPFYPLTLYLNYTKNPFSFNFTSFFLINTPNCTGEPLFPQF